MAAGYIPFDATTEEIEARQVLRDGVPASMSASLLAWIRTRLADGTWARLDVLHEIENNLDVPFGLGTRSLLRIEGAMEIMNQLDQRTLLKVTDYLVYRMSTTSSWERHSLDRILAEGRSKWTVGERPKDHYGLVERVPAGVQDAAEALIAEGGSAGGLLALAWGYAHDFQPNDSAAYASAVKAVEAAAIPALGITREATLGDITRVIEGQNGKDTRWRLPFLREHGAHPSKVVLVGMLRSLYRGQRDRHGSADYSGVTHDEALAAVLMAVTLVGLFSGGLVQERDTEQYG